MAIEPNSIRRDVATVLVRFAGVYFAYLAVSKVLAVPLLIFMLRNIGSLTDISIGELVSLSTILPSLLHLIIYSGLAYYLLLRANWLINFLAKVRESERSL